MSEEKPKPPRKNKGHHVCLKPRKRIQPPARNGNGNRPFLLRVIVTAMRMSPVDEICAKLRAQRQAEINRRYPGAKPEMTRNTQVEKVLTPAERQRQYHLLRAAFPGY